MEANVHYVFARGKIENKIFMFKRNKVPIIISNHIANCQLNLQFYAYMIGNYMDW